MLEKMVRQMLRNQLQELKLQEKIMMRGGTSHLYNEEEIREVRILICQTREAIGE